MPVPQVGLFNWLFANSPKAEYNLGFSNMAGVEYDEFVRLTGHEIPGDYNLGDEHGNPDLITSLCEMYGCGKESVITSAGATEGNTIAYMAMLESGDDFVIERPGYEPMGLAPRIVGANAIPWQRKFEDRFLPNIGSLEDTMTDRTKLVVMTNLHNPSGTLTPRSHVQKIAGIAASHGAYVLIDEIFLEGAFKPQRSAFGIDNVMITTSLTKIFGLGGLRAGWLIAPEEVAERCKWAKFHTTAVGSQVSEMMTAQALQNAHEALRNRFLERARPNHDMVKKWVGSNADIIDYVEPAGGILSFPRYRADMPSIELCTRMLDETGIIVNPGYFFGLEGHFRMSYALPTEKLGEALERLGEWLRTL